MTNSQLAERLQLETQPRSQLATKARPRLEINLPWAKLVTAIMALGLCLGVAMAGEAGSPSLQARTTMIVFILAVWAWAFTRIDDTFVSLGAGTILVLSGTLGPEELFASLGDDTIWLLVAAFVIAAGVTSSGLAARAAAWLVTGSDRPRVLFHLITAAIVATVFAAPSTSGRAALLLPVFTSLAAALAATPGASESEQETRQRLIHALSLLFPTVILLSAVGSFLGAGAHLVTSHIVATATGQGFSFASWLLIGLPLAIVSSHLATELILWLFTRRADRRARTPITIEALQANSDTPLTGQLTLAENRSATLLGAVVLLWCTESLHGINPAIVALLGALVTALPNYGSVKLKKALAAAPWSLLIFMAATLAMGDALVSTGAAAWIADTAFTALQISSPWPFMIAVVVLSVAAHLVIQSRSARSAVLVPIVVALAPAVGVDPAAAAFASTAAAGFCHTLPSSAKPVAMFADVPGIHTFAPPDLRRLSLWLAPLTALLVLGFSRWVWPLLGLGW